MSPVQEIVPAYQTISILALELLCCHFLAFLALDELIGCSAKRAEGLTTPVQTIEPPRADPMVEATPAAPILESLRARQQEEESTTAAGKLDDDE